MYMIMLSGELANMLEVSFSVSTYVDLNGNGKLIHTWNKVEAAKKVSPVCQHEPVRSYADE